MKISIIASEFAVGKGGLQSFAYYAKEALSYRNIPFTTFSRSTLSLKRLIVLFFHNFSNKIFILADWEQVIFVIISVFLTKLGLRKCKYVVILHGNEILNVSFIKLKILKWIARDRRVFFIANSTGTAEIFYQYYWRKCSLIAHPFIDSAIYKVNSKGKSIKKSSKTGKKTLLTITRLVKRKNVKNVILAIDILKKKGFNIVYNIIGDGPQINELNQLIETLNLQKEVKVLGFIDENEKIYHLQNSDIFILPSIFDPEEGSIEGYGIVFTEASLFGLPSISGNTGGMTDAVVSGKTGFHTDGTVADIVKKIIKVFNTNFDKKVMYNHALAHDYRSQDPFITFIDSLKDD